MGPVEGEMGREPDVLALPGGAPGTAGSRGHWRSPFPHAVPSPPGCKGGARPRAPACMAPEHVQSFPKGFRASPPGPLQAKHFCSCLWKLSPDSLGPQGALRSPDPSVSTSGYNCSLFKTPLLPKQEILNQGCPSLPESTLAEKEGGGEGKQARGRGSSHTSPRSADHTHTHTYSQRYAHRCTQILLMRSVTRTHEDTLHTQAHRYRHTHTSSPFTPTHPRTLRVSHVHTDTHTCPGLPVPKLPHTHTDPDPRPTPPTPLR